MLVIYLHKEMCRGGLDDAAATASRISWILAPVNNSKGHKAWKCAAHALNTGEEEYKRIASFFQKLFVALVKGNAALFNHRILVTTVYM